VALAFLEFLYTDHVEALDAAYVELNFALDLLSLADQYLVEALKRKCEVAIQKSINVENVSSMLSTAESRQARELRKNCLEFILANFGQVKPNALEGLMDRFSMAIKGHGAMTLWIPWRLMQVIATRSFSELPINLLQEVLVEASRRGVQVGGGCRGAVISNTSSNERE